MTRHPRAGTLIGLVGVVGASALAEAAIWTAYAHASRIDPDRVGEGFGGQPHQLAQSFAWLALLLVLGIALIYAIVRLLNMRYVGLATFALAVVEIIGGGYLGSKLPGDFAGRAVAVAIPLFVTLFPCGLWAVRQGRKPINTKEEHLND